MILQSETQLLNDTQIFTDDLNLQETNDANALKRTYTEENEFLSDPSNENIESQTKT